MRREDHQARVGDAHEHDHHVTALGSAGLLVVCERGLVPVVAVGDQETAVGERLAECVVLQAPETSAFDLDVGRAFRNVERRVAFVEEKDRLELGTRLAKEPQPSFLRAAMRSLVRQDRAGLVRLQAKRSDEARPRARDAVRADVVLRERPERGRFLAEDTVVAPVAEAAPGLLLGVRQRQVNDVVGAPLRGIAPVPPARSRHRAARRDRRAGRQDRSRSGGRETA